MGRLTMDASGKVIPVDAITEPEADPFAGAHSTEPAREESPVATPTVRILTGAIEHEPRPAVVRLVNGDTFEVDLPGLPTETLDVEGATRLAGALERAVIDGATVVGIEWHYGTHSHEDTMPATDATELAAALRGTLSTVAA